MLKKVLFLLVLLSCLPTSSQSADNEQAEAFFISLIVDDIERSEQWYTDVFGFKIESKNSNKERGFIIVNMKRNGMMLELIQLDSATSMEDIQELKPEIKRIQGIFKFGISVNNFDEWITRFNANNINTDELIVKIPGSEKRMLVLRDPDGNRVQLFEN